MIVLFDRSDGTIVAQQVAIEDNKHNNNNNNHSEQSSSTIKSIRFYLE